MGMGVGMVGDGKVWKILMTVEWYCRQCGDF